MSTAVVLDEPAFRAAIRDEIRAAIQAARPAPPPQKAILTNREVLELLGVSKLTLQRYRDAGKIKYSKVGGLLFYKRQDVLEFVDRHVQ